MPARLCVVSLTDERGTTHRVHVQASSLYEAIGLAVQTFRCQEWVPPIGPATRLQVEVRTPIVQHEATVAAVQQWTDSTPTSPADKLQRARVRAMLLGSARS